MPPTWQTVKGGLERAQEQAVSIMTAAQQIAGELGQRGAFVDNSSWLFCAKDGPYLADSELAAIARGRESPHQASP